MSIERFNVNIATIVTKAEPAILTSVLGSCLGIVLYDPKKKNGSLAHAMLPSIDNASKRGLEKPAKYVDSAIEIQLKKLNKLGSKPSDLVAKLIGGASMFKARGQNTWFNIGERNVEIALEILKKLDIKVVAKDVGYDFGRSIEFNLSTGIITISKAGGKQWKTI